MAAKVQALRSETAHITFFSSSLPVVSVSSNADMVRRWASGAAVVAGKLYYGTITLKLQLSAFQC